MSHHTTRPIAPVPSSRQRYRSTVGPRSAALAIALAAGAACAQDCDNDGTPDAQQTFRWRANGPAFWGSSSAWQSPGGGVPDGSSLALFDGTDGLGTQPYTPFFDGFAGVRGLGVLNCDATFDLGSSVFAVSGTATGCREFLLGGPLGADMFVTGGGQFRVNRAVLADQPGTTARLIMDGSNQPIELRHLNPAPMIVGQFGAASVTLIDAEFNHDGPLVLGSRENSEGQIVVSGDSLLRLSAETTSDVFIGFAGKGFIGLEQEGVLLNNNPIAFRLGDRETGEGELRFTGLQTNQSFTASLLEIGGQGFGELRVLSGSDVSALVGGSVVLGASPGSRGEIDVLNFASLEIAGVPLEAGLGGQAVVSIGEGSALSTPNTTIAFVDSIVQGSGLLEGDLRLIGGEIFPNNMFAETGAPQRLQVAGKLLFSGTNPETGIFETGRMTYKLADGDPAESIYADVASSVTVDGTLRVTVPAGVRPKIGEKYTVIDGASLTGVFDAVQTEVIENAAIAVPVYSPGNGEVAIEFIDIGVGQSVLENALTANPQGNLVDAVVEDLDLDGFPDLVVIDDRGPGQAGVVRVARNLGVSPTGGWLGFDPSPDAYSTLGDIPASLAIGDMNDDRLPDLVLMNRGPADGQIRIRLNNTTSPGDFSQVDPREITIPGLPADITLADVAGSGLLDVITVYQRNSRGTGDGGIRVDENTGNGFDDSDGDTGDDPGSVDSMGGVFSATGVAATSKAQSSAYIFGASAAAGNIEFENRGQIFPLFFLQEVPTGREPDNLFTADLSGDGLDDVIVSDGVSGTISVLVAQDFGEIIYADAVSLDAGGAQFGGQPGSIVAVDINDDDRLDIVYTARDAQGVRRLRAILNIAEGDNGELIFGKPQTLPDDAGPPRVLAVADLDNNGTDDLVVVHEPESGPPVTTFTVPGPGPCTTADLAFPFGVLDLNDIGVFLNAFTTQQPAADLAPPFGVYDLSDISVFINSFTTGCP